MRANANQRKMSPISAVNALLLVSLSLLLLPDLVVTEFVEMRLVEVNGAGWYLQLVSNRRGPGHLIICLLIARRRTNRSCRKEARTKKKNTAQRSHTSRQEQQRARLLAGGHQLGKDALGDAGLAYVPRLPQETRRAAAPGSSLPPPRRPTPTAWSPGPLREPLWVRATRHRLARPLLRCSLAPSAPPAGCSARQAQARGGCRLQGAGRVERRPEPPAPVSAPSRPRD